MLFDDAGAGRLVLLANRSRQSWQRTSNLRSLGLAEHNACTVIIDRDKFWAERCRQRSC
jgi:hypothetical protein